MSCTRFQYELSQNLDGRLPSGRREALLEHLAECAACTALSDDLQRAQDLALSLPAQRVADGFRTGLWDRIRAGEGTPEAVFQEAVSLWTKARYVASGAAAAAVLLLILGVFAKSDPSIDPIDPGSASPAPIAHAEPGPDAAVDMETAPVSPMATLARLGAPRPMAPMPVAEAAQLGCVNSVRSLQQQVATLEPELGRLAPREVVTRIAEPVDSLRGAATLIRWMQDQDIIQLPGEFQAELRIAVNGLQMIDRAARTDNVQELTLAFRQLREIDVGKLQHRFRVMCCQNPAEFLEQFRHHFVQNPDARRVLRVEISDDPAFGGGPFLLRSGNPFGAMLFMPPALAEPEAETPRRLRPTTGR
jgi:hypothetical protein